MQTHRSCEQLGLEGFESREVGAAFDGMAITSATGPLLLCRRRNPDLTVHSVRTGGSPAKTRHDSL